MKTSFASILRSGIAAAGIFLLTGPALAQDMTSPILQGPVRAIPGPKRTIAVGQIDINGAMTPPGSTWNVGGGLGSMLSTALGESGRFTVVERNALTHVLSEQQMTANGLTGGIAAPVSGAILPAQYVVVGAVSEFGVSDKGGGLSLGGASGLFSGALSMSKTKGSVALDLRVIDTRTSAQVAAFKVKRDISSTAIGFTGGYSNIALDGNQFWSTPLGEATRAAITDAVDHIAAAVASGQWQGVVVESESGLVYVNAGADSGLRNGDHLTIQRMGKAFTDPVTGAVLFQRKAVLGTVEITSVEDKLASGRYLAANAAAMPQRGDLVVMEN